MPALPNDLATHGAGTAHSSVFWEICTGGVDWRGDCTYSRRRIAKSWTRPSPSATVGERRPHAPAASSRKVEGYGRRARNGEEAYGSSRVCKCAHTRAAMRLL